MEEDAETLLFYIHVTEDDIIILIGETTVFTSNSVDFWSIKRKKHLSILKFRSGFNIN